jgi:hypothetical protein
LTIGMPTYRDFHGVYFTIQALRLYQDLRGVEILVVDNHGCPATRRFVEGFAGARYVSRPDLAGAAAAKDQVFREAAGRAVLCIDCHVLLLPGVVRRLKQFYRRHPDCNDLLQGPLLYDDLATLASHLDPVWRGGMWGIWAIDRRAEDAEAKPFEIPMQGMGLFSCRRDAWPGYHPGFVGFGGEEGYIHEKFRARGRRCLCLPWLRWVHRFDRPEGVPFRLLMVDRIRNYLIGHRELGLDESAVLTHFRDLASPAEIEKARQDAQAVQPLAVPNPVPTNGAPVAAHGRHTHKPGATARRPNTKRGRQPARSSSPSRPGSAVRAGRLHRNGRAIPVTAAQTHERQQRAALFRRAFETNVWGGQDSVSGTGSSLEQTAHIRRALPLLFRKYGVKTLLDIPCGDFFWMKSVNLSGVRYVGADIVPALVKQNRRHQSATIAFRRLDLVTDTLPQVDLVLCRDCLGHFSVQDVFRALQNIRRSRSTLLLATTFPRRSWNADIPTGQWRPINLQADPFRLPCPMELIEEGCTEASGQFADKSLGLWMIADLFASDQSAGAAPPR